jgi:hypothetical protein
MAFSQQFLEDRARNAAYARAKKLTRAQRVASAKKAINARWDKWRAERGLQPGEKKTAKRVAA